MPTFSRKIGMGSNLCFGSTAHIPRINKVITKPLIQQTQDRNQNISLSYPHFKTGKLHKTVHWISCAQLTYECLLSLRISSYPLRERVRIGRCINTHFQVKECSILTANSFATNSRNVRWSSLSDLPSLLFVQPFLQIYATNYQ